jgi:uncharacterized protein
MALNYTAVPQELIALIRSEFALSWDGIHGVAHWERVRDNGLRLAELTGANPQIVELFAFLHDAKRCNDGKDPDHGKRAAAFARSLRGSLITLPDGDMALLTFACEYHADGLTEADITVQACWDADRLDLGRIGVRPNPRYLCTPAARDPEMIAWAFSRSRQAAHSK